MEVNERVFKMYLYLKDHTFERSAIADLLEITSRQLTRLLNKWQDEGILTYTSGMGRGHASELKFNVNIEREFVNYMLRNIDKYEVSKLQEIMNYDMSDSSRKILRICIDESLYGNKEQQVKRAYHVDYFYQLPKTVDPLSTIDLTLGTLLLNLGTRLYYIRDEEILSHMVIYDEWIGNDFIIHLHRNIRFSNGDLLHACDVRDCIMRWKEEKKDEFLFNQLEDVEVLSGFKVMLKFKRRIESLKITFSQEFATIYKKINDEFIFTGPYQLHSQDDDMIKLTLNPYYYRGYPDITDLMFVNDLEKYQEYSKEHQFKPRAAERYFSINFFLFNPSTKLSFRERQLIIDIIQQRESIDKKCERPVKVLIIQYSKKWITDIIQRLRDFMEVEVVEIPFEVFISEPLTNYDVDIAVMNELLTKERQGYDLLTTGKMADWYQYEKESKELLFIYNYRHKEYWPYAEKKYLSYLTEDAWLTIVKVYKKDFYFPGYFEDIMTNEHGIINYASIKKLNEVIHHD